MRTGQGDIKTAPARVPNRKFKQIIQIPTDADLKEKAEKRLKVVGRKLAKFKGFSKETLTNLEVKKKQYEKTVETREND